MTEFLIVDEVYTMQALGNVLLFIFNSTGVLSLKYNKLTQSLELSKLIFAKNVLLSPMLLMLKAFLLVNLDISKAFVEDKVLIPGLTQFFDSLNDVSWVMYLVTVILCAYIQLFKQKKILNVCNNFMKFLKDDERVTFLPVFKRKLSKILSLSIAILLFNSVVEFSISYKLNLSGLLVYVVGHYELLFLFTNIYFIGMFMLLFEIFLKNFHHEIKQISCESSYNDISIRRTDLLTKFLDFHKLVMDFNDAFGDLLTILTIFEVTDMTIKVMK